MRERSITGLQVTVGYRTLADQNLLVSEEIPTVVGHDVRQSFYLKSVYSKDE